MAGRTIPIHPIRLPRAVAAAPLVQTLPLLSGEPDRLATVLRALHDALHAAPGTALDPPNWLRELHLTESETHLSFAPTLCQDGRAAADLVFTTLCRLLPDTDIYLKAAPR